MITAETLIGVSISILYISRTIGLYRDTLVFEAKIKEKYILAQSMTICKNEKVVYILWIATSELGRKLAQRLISKLFDGRSWHPEVTSPEDAIRIVLTVNFDHFTQPKAKSRPSISVRCIIGWEITSHFYKERVGPN
jgi:signal peptidase I